MKLTLGKKDVAYTSLESQMDSPQAPTPPATLRRSASSSLANVQLDSPSASSSVTVDSEYSDGYFVNHGGGATHQVGGGFGPHGDAAHVEPRSFYHSVAHDVVLALERPVRQLAFEIKGALLATGCVLRVLGELTQCGRLTCWHSPASRPPATCSRGSRRCSSRSSSPSSSCTRLHDEPGGAEDE